MATLPFQIERFIVKQLACEEEPAAIAEDVQGKFLRDIDDEVVEAYSPDADGDALTPDLRELYEYTRGRYLGEDDAEEERSFVSVATTDEVEAGTIHCVDVNEKTVILIERDGEYAALDNRCTHQGGSLCDGDLSEDTITCPLHGAEFDLDTGDPAAPPATEAVDTYDLRIEDDRIEVKV